MNRDKIYFISDLHLGAPNKKESKKREKKFVNWLEIIKKDAKTLFVIGDLFDFWFEYKTVVPKGFVRALGKLAELSDSGVKIHFFTGNHDLWMRDYLTEELGIEMHFERKEFVFDKKIFLIGHGDGLGPGDKGYKRMKKVFTNKFCQFLFRWMHPDIGMKLGSYLSLENKLISGDEDDKFYGEKEFLLAYSRKKLEQKHYDYFVFGHRHLPLDIKLSDKSRYVNTGEWLKSYSYAVFYKGELELKYFV